MTLLKFLKGKCKNNIYQIKGVNMKQKNKNEAPKGFLKF